MLQMAVVPEGKGRLAGVCRPAKKGGGQRMGRLTRYGLGHWIKCHSDDVSGAGGVVGGPRFTGAVPIQPLLVGNYPLK
jgi:hypothetical protein